MGEIFKEGKTISKWEEERKVFFERREKEIKQLEGI